MSSRRKDPEALLAQIEELENRSKRGRLKLFFGMAAGVGKTYAMLEAGRALRLAGRKVLVGWVETHGRVETAALLEGMERLPPRTVEYRGVALQEFDLDAGVAAHPDVLLLDELAHTNAPGSRHSKRWQDMVEVLDSGIDVYTTLNVQHVESLNDVVAQITGVTVRETVPDLVLDQADEIELIDLPPDDLLQRLREGKVYVPEQARLALEAFFRKGNLLALRELALRRTAERVDAQMQRYRRDHAISRTWPVADRILVAVGANPLAARLVRAARRMAVSLRAEWIAAHVETPASAGLRPRDRETLTENLRLAESLGGRTVVLPGRSVGDELLAYAREHNVTKIVVGKPTHPWWRDRIAGSLVEQIVRGSGDIDVYVITGEGEEATSAHAPFRPAATTGYASALAAVGFCTLLAWALRGILAPPNLMMVYLLGVVFVATRSGRGPSALASCLSVAAFDFFFVPPYFSFAVSDTQYLVTFGAMLLVALLLTRLASQVREQAQQARSRERRTSVLYSMTRDLTSATGVERIAAIASRHLAGVFQTSAAVILPRSDGRLVPLTDESATFTLDPRDEGVARWVFDHGRPAGIGTDTLPGAGAVFFPLVASSERVGVLAVRPLGGEPLTPDQTHLLEALGSQTAAAIERGRLADEAQRGRLEVEAQRVRSSILGTLSRNLQPPVGAIREAAKTLLDRDQALTASERRALLQHTDEEARHLNRLVANLLELIRLESGSLKPRKEWRLPSEIVERARARVASSLESRVVSVHVPPDLPRVPMDPVLIEHVLVNLLDNAARHTPQGTPVEISAWTTDKELVVEVADRGPGLAPERQVLGAPRDEGAEDTGLGLAVCRGLLAAHSGRLWAEPREGGGSLFRFALPLKDEPAPITSDTQHNTPPGGGTLLPRALLLLLLFPGVARAQAIEAPADAKPSAEKPLDEREPPFANLDSTWLNGSNRQPSSLLQAGPATFTLYVDTYYAWQFADPVDHTIFPTTVAPRHSEISINLASMGVDIGGLDGPIGRFYVQAGNNVDTTAGQDATTTRGFYLSQTAFKYIREAAAGWHFHTLHGINLEAGIFASYLGESYLPQENWCYTHTFASDATPYYFSGVRAQIFPTQKLKFEVWLVNGWQTLGSWHDSRSGGFLLSLRPSAPVSLQSGFYAGREVQGDPNSMRIYSDNSLQVQYFHREAGLLRRSSLNLVADIGHEHRSNAPSGPMGGVALANRFEWTKKIFSTLRGDFFYDRTQAVLLPLPLGSPYTLPDRGPLHAFGFTSTLDFNPSPWILTRLEYAHRSSNLRYFSGPGGITGPGGVPAADPSTFRPDLRRSDDRILANVTLRL